VTLYQDASRIYGELHLTSTAQDSLDQLDQWIARILTDIHRSHGDQQRALQDILWTFYDLTAKVYSDDLNNWEKALYYLNEEMSIAESLKNDELRAASLYRSGQIRFAQRQYPLAKSDLDGALVFVKSPQVNPQLKSAVLASASLAHAIVDKDEKGKKVAQSLIQQSGAIISDLKEPEDARFVKFDYGKYLLEYADVLIALGRPVTAINTLDDAADEIDVSMRRRHAYINILQAVANLRLKSPRYDVATDLLSGAFAVSKDIKSSFNIGQVTKYYNELRQSPYANATDVADLGIEIRVWRKQR
jgi:tetratricopeptide (TPR) repeat protein